jgi:hypothetical protein
MTLAAWVSSSTLFAKQAAPSACLFPWFDFIQQAFPSGLLS